jgi:catechol 2,3-dioxygenase-like lactoylglutathione lyase family enzyme
MSNESAGTNPANDLKLEIVAIPVSDVDRAKQFYVSMGWRLDADFAHDDWRVIQLTPPGSPCSLFLGRGLTSAVPGSSPGLMLAVDNLDAARAELVAQGVPVSEVFHFEGDRIHFHGATGRLAGPDPQRRSYLSFASFKDPDGNEWLLQEITARLPGRGQSSMNVATLVSLLREAEDHHGRYEATAPKHDWADWYAAYLVARERGRAPEQAAVEAARRMQSRR